MSEPAARSPQRLPTTDGTRLAILFSATNVVLYTLMSLAQWAGWGGLTWATETSTAEVLTELLAVTLVNVVFGVVLVAGTFALQPMRRGWRARAAIIGTVALVAALGRAIALLAVPSVPSTNLYWRVEWAEGFAAGVVALGAGVLAASLIERARTEERRREDEARRAARAAEELQEEELRVRRMVADELHGTLQHHLVAVTAGLDALSADLQAEGDAARAQDVRRWAETLEEIREQDVRSLSHAVFPTGTDLGTAEAIAIMLRRLPPQVDATIEVGPTYRRLAESEDGRLPIAERLVAVYAVEEAVTNALKHGHASTVRVRAEAQPTDDGRWVFEAVVDDDGTGLAAADPPLHGLERHRERIEGRGGSITLTSGPAGGARLTFRIPFGAVDGDRPPLDGARARP